MFAKLAKAFHIQCIYNNKNMRKDMILLCLAHTGGTRGGSQNFSVS